MEKNGWRILGEVSFLLNRDSRNMRKHYGCAGIIFLHWKRLWTTETAPLHHRSIIGKGLIDNIVRFSNLLRDNDVAVSLPAVLDTLKGLPLIDISILQQFKCLLQVNLIKMRGSSFFTLYSNLSKMKAWPLYFLFILFYFCSMILVLKNHLDIYE